VGEILTVNEYCKAEKVSRAKLYKERRAGEGVAFFKRGSRIFISQDARLAYRERLAQQTAAERAK
jgi:hypothetical protein